ncbi:MAG: DUF4446 family protein [Candidatus Daviesbacteria bacterium]|nr:MAG: DUF4446 family protein [Candidatus Daviesbacteria bacterium]
MYSVWGSILPFWVVFLTVVTTLWLGILSYLGFRNQKFLQNLFPKSNERDIRKKFEEVLKSVEEFKEDLKEVRVKLADLQRDGLTHVQNTALLRYNPYDNTGGDLSFSLALLDEGGNGLVVTSLHSVSGTRVFAKPVILGKSGKYELSSEEKTVVKQALKHG